MAVSADAGASDPDSQTVFSKKLTIYAAAGAIILVAWVLNVAQLYWMAGALVVLPQVTRLFGILEHRGVDVERLLPAAGHQGDAATVRLRVWNRLALPKLNLAVDDDLPAGLGRLEQEPVPVHLPPRGSDVAEYRLQLRRRGVHRLRGLSLVSEDALGLHQIATRLAVDSEIVVYPRVIELPPDYLPDRWGGGQTAALSSFRRGEGCSFFGIREYRPGDPLRHVHWRSAARLGRLSHPHQDRPLTLKEARVFG